MFLKMDAQVESNESGCFVCGEQILNFYNKLISTRTKYTGTLLIEKLSDLVGSDCTIVVAENDNVCDNCCKLFNKMDFLEKNLENVKLILSRRLNFKYDLNDEQVKDHLNEVPNLTNFENNIPGTATMNFEVQDDVNREYLQKSCVNKIGDGKRKKFHCLICDLKIQNEVRFDRHIMQIHVIKEQSLNENRNASNIFTCRICNLSFVNLNLCKNHIKINHLNVNSNLKLKTNGTKCVKFIKSYNGTGNEGLAIKEENTVCLQSKQNANSHCKLIMSSCYDSRFLLNNNYNSTKLKEIKKIKCKNLVNCSNDVFKSGSKVKVSNVNELDGLSCDYVKYSIINNNSKQHLVSSSKNDDVNISNNFHDLVTVKGKKSSINSNKSEETLLCKKLLKEEESCCKDYGNNFSNEVSNNVTNEFINIDCKNSQNFCSKSDKIIVNSYDLSLFIDKKNSDEQMYKNCNDGLSKVIGRNTNLSNEINNSSKNSMLLAQSNDISDVNLIRHNSSGNTNEQNILQFIELFNSNSMLVKESREILPTDNSSQVTSLIKTDDINIDKKTNENQLKINDNVNCNNLLESDDQLNVTNCNDRIVSWNMKTFKNLNDTINSSTEAKSTVPCHESVIKNDQLHCFFCDSTFQTESSFKKHHMQHLQNDNLPNLIVCCDCGDKFPDITSVYAHNLAKHSDWKGCYCYLCNIRYHENNFTQFVEHCKRVHALKKICTFCGKNFKSESYFINHIEFAHRGNLNCNICAKLFTNLKKLKIHEKNHIRCDFVCDICNKLLKTQNGLKLHKLLHSGVYPFICEFCGKGFVSAISLSEHKSNHVKESRYICDVCGKEFHLYDTYHKHRKHHDNPYPKQCDICKQHFRSASRVAEHKRRKHTFERPYKCPYCPLSFHISNLLKYHLCIHTKQYPFTCAVCKKGFPARNKHAMHMSKKHKDDSYIKNRFPNNKERREEWLKFSRKDV